MASTSPFLIANFASCLGKYDTSLCGTTLPVLDSSGQTLTADISFNSGSYLLNTTNFPVYQGTGNGFSVMGWFYPTTETSNATPIVDLSSNSSYNIVVCCSGTNINPCLSAYYNGQWVTTYGSAVGSGGAVNLNAWNYFCYTVCCSGNNAVQNLYLNTIGTDNSPATATNSSATFDTNLKILNTMVAYGNAGFTNYFIGKVDDFRFYSRVLTPMEYRVLYGYKYANMSGSSITPSLGTVSMGAPFISNSSPAQTFIFSNTGAYSYLQVARTSNAGVTTYNYISAAQLVSTAGGTSYTWTDYTGVAGAQYYYIFTPFILSVPGTQSSTLSYTPVAYNVSVSNITYNSIIQNTYSSTINGILYGSSLYNGNTYYCYAFLNTAYAYVINYTCYVNTRIYVQAIGGGGGGGCYGGGGGGAGGVVMIPVTLPAGTGTITINVGAGGSGAVGTTSAQTTAATAGSNTTVAFSANAAANITAWGGGNGTTDNGVSGGSGSGGGNGSSNYTGGITVNVYNNYGNSALISAVANATGGGAGAGTTANASIITSINPGAGGAGIQCPLPGISTFAPSGIAYGTYYWAGGGGGCYNGYSVQYGNGGIGGGGGGASVSTSATNSTGGGSAINTGFAGTNNASSAITTAGAGGANTGSGGGAAWFGSGGAGGSGIVVIAFPQSAIVYDASAVLSAAQQSDLSSIPILSNPTLSSIAVGAIKGAFSCKLVNISYFGPTITLRYPNDACGNFTQNFYSDVYGNMCTGYNGTGTSVANWLSQNGTNTTYAYVTKWYNQGMDVCFNSAVQYTMSSQPIYEVSNQLINFGITNGASGTVISPQTNSFLNLPTGAAPFGDASYTFTANHGVFTYAANNYPTIFGFGQYGTIDGMNALALGSSATTSAYYSDLWYSDDLVGASANPVTTNNTFTVKYTSGHAASSRQAYVNGTNLTTFTTGTGITNVSPTNNRNQIATNNYIGGLAAAGGTTMTTAAYFNSQLHYAYMFNIALTDADRLLIESSTYVPSTLMAGTHTIGFTAPSTGPTTISNLTYSYPLSGSITNSTSMFNGVSYNVYSFTAVGGSYTMSYSLPAATSTYIYVLAVGGGGGGGCFGGSGGGGGGVVMNPVLLSGTGTVTVTVGSGGMGAVGTTIAQTTAATSGSNTTVTFSTNTSANITAWGGGSGSTTNGGNGGSGAGAANGYVGGYGISINNNYGNVALSNNVTNTAGGGAGAGTTNSGTAKVTNAGSGGAGIQCNLPGINTFAPFGTAYGTYYWGGGGGGCANSFGTTQFGNGGIGGGGGGASVGTTTTNATGGTNAINNGMSGINVSSTNVTTTAGSAGANTGGGGGAAWFGNGGAGGSGIVVIAFPQTTLTSNAQAVLTSSQMVSGVYNDIMSMTSISSNASNAIKGGFACRLINYNYFGPIMTLRHSADVCGNYTTNFYADVLGNFGTGYLGTGTSIYTWLASNKANTTYAYVTKWYNQGMDVCFNSATQYTLGSQPIFDYSNGFINFGYTGASGGVVAPQTNTFFNLPNGALPFNDSSYSVITRLGNYTTTAGTYYPVAGGTSTNWQSFGGFYLNGTNYLYGGATNNTSTAAQSIAANNLLAFTYTSTGTATAGTSTLWVNDIANVYSSNTTIRSQPATGNAIGAFIAGSNYLNAQMYYMYIYSVAIYSTDRLVNEVIGYAKPNNITYFYVNMTIPAGVTSATLTWSAIPSTSISYYNIYLNNALYAYDVSNSTPISSYTVNGVSTTGTNFVSVNGYIGSVGSATLAYLGNGYATYSSSATATTAIVPIFAPTPFGAFTVSSLTSTGFTLSWMGGSGTGVSYTYSISTSSGIVTGYTTTGTNPTVFNSISSAYNYTITVTATNTIGSTIGTYSLVNVVLPTTFGTFTPSAVGYNNFTLSWTGGWSATVAYSYSISIVGGAVQSGYTAVTNISTTSGGTSTATFSGISWSNNYAITITATNNAGSVVGNYTLTNIVTPSAFGTITSSNVTATGFVLSWTGGWATSVVYTYAVTVSGVTQSGYSTVTNTSATSSGTSYAYFSGLSWSNDYAITITATNTAGSINSSAYTLTNITTPTAFGTVSSSNLMSNGFTLSWTGGWATAVTYSYVVTSGGVTQSGYTTSTNTSTTSGGTSTAAFSGLSWANNYVITITATNTAGSSSSSAYTLTNVTTPTTFGTISTVNTNSSGFVLSWTGGWAKVVNYFYVVNISGGAVQSGYNVVTNTSSTSGGTSTAAFTGLSSANNYSVVIDASNNAGAVYSSTYYVTMLSAPTAFGTISTTSTNSNGFNLSWTGGWANVVTYTYSVAITGGSTQSGYTYVTNTSTTSGGTSTASFSGLSWAYNYTVTITATNNVGTLTSSAYNVVNVSTPSAFGTISAIDVSSGFILSWVGGWANTVVYTYAITSGGSSVSTSTYSVATTIATSGSGTNTAVFTGSGLSIGRNYVVTITATTFANSGGTASTTTGTATLTNITTPSPISGFITTNVTTAGFTVSWTPLTNGGINYSFSITPNAGTYQTDNYSFVTYSGLSNSTTYTVTVTATNALGTSSGNASGTTSGVAAAPTAITGMSYSNPTYTPPAYSGANSNAGFTVTWSGGSGATSYTYNITYTHITLKRMAYADYYNIRVLNNATNLTVQCSGYSPTTSGPTNSVTFTGLTNATSGSWNVTVTATNANGSSSNTLNGCKSVTRYIWAAGVGGTISNNSICYSSDGTTWNQVGVVASNTEQWVSWTKTNGGYYGNGRIYIASNYYIAYATNGKSSSDWTVTATSSLPNTNNVAGTMGGTQIRIAYGNNRLVLINQYSYPAGYTSNTSSNIGFVYYNNNLTSVTGCNLSGSYSSATTGPVSLAYGGGYFLAGIPAAGAGAAISSDGATFSIVNLDSGFYGSVSSGFMSINTEVCYIYGNGGNSAFFMWCSTGNSNWNPNIILYPAPSSNATSGFCLVGTYGSGLNGLNYYPSGSAWPGNSNIQGLGIHPPDLVQFALYEPESRLVYFGGGNNGNVSGNTIWKVPIENITNSTLSVYTNLFENCNGFTSGSNWYISCHEVIQGYVLRCCTRNNNNGGSVLAYTVVAGPNKTEWTNMASTYNTSYDSATLFQSDNASNTGVRCIFVW